MQNSDENKRSGASSMQKENRQKSGTRRTTIGNLGRSRTSLRVDHPTERALNLQKRKASKIAAREEGKKVECNPPLEANRLPAEKQFNSSTAGTKNILVDKSTNTTDFQVNEYDDILQTFPLKLEPNCRPFNSSTAETRNILMDKSLNTTDFQVNEYDDILQTFPLKLEPNCRPFNSSTAGTRNILVDESLNTTDFQVNEYDDILQTFTLKQESNYRDLQWTEPSLRKKIAIVKEKYGGKAMTVPYDKKRMEESEAATSLEAAEYEEADAFFHIRKDNIIFKCLFYLSTLSYFVVLMCCLTLITIVCWKLLDGNLISSHRNDEHNVYLSGIRYVISQIEIAIGIMAQGFHSLLEKIECLFTLWVT